MTKRRYTIVVEMSDQYSDKQTQGWILSAIDKSLGERQWIDRVQTKVGREVIADWDLAQNRASTAQWYAQQRAEREQRQVIN